MAKHLSGVSKTRKRRPGELAPKEAQLKISHLQFATLVVNFIMATKSSEIGYENTARTLQEFQKELEARFPKVVINVSDLEDLLCAVNQRAEQGSFWSPMDGESFEAFLKKMFWYARLDGERLTLDRDYNTITYLTALEPEDLTHGTNDVR